MGRHANAAIFVPHAGCPHRCSFCDQRAIAGQSRLPTAQEVEAVCRRAVQTMACPPQDAEIAFFGGSFTAIPRPDMRALLEAAAPFVREGRFRGIRLSTRPDCVDADVIGALKECGVTAVELGAQSMDDRVLRKNERGHTAADVEKASRLIKEAGLELGLQMMTGLPDSSPRADWDTARRLAALSPAAVRIYPAVVMRGTRLAEWYAAGAYAPPSLEETVELCAGLLRFFEEEKGIPVIRLGLHAGPELETGRVAGPWHPAFRELCEGRLYLEKARRVLAGVPAGPVTLRVHPAAVSRLIGQRRGNVQALRAQGWLIRVRPDETVPPGDIRAGG